MLSDPDGVISTLIHDVKALQSACIHILQVAMPTGPTEELKNCDFHPGTLYLVYDSKIGWQDPERKASSLYTYFSLATSSGSTKCRR